ncbi:hypothetical protein BDB00DRAFT_789335 [Zychaea mexicana]|uniref:uncharacterized protein n=1 Tax=Zychaea mexicana TaxID=64656 RepID=UPI0022FF1311|nr:uncharacterized protein BDB00DRAFT_789335 [Zychaea mexicana]KAI9491680.1 hypothetical protein BDB00DRAFT_789335 [Zychaea mexicana]
MTSEMYMTLGSVVPKLDIFSIKSVHSPLGTRRHEFPVTLRNLEPMSLCAGPVIVNMVGIALKRKGVNGRKLVERRTSGTFENNDTINISESPTAKIESPVSKVKPTISRSMVTDNLGHRQLTLEA